MNESVEQILKYKYQPPFANYNGTTKYNVGGKLYDVPPWSHPASLARKILNRVYHKKFWGVMIIGSMGDGKTSVAQCIVHHIHKKAQNFEVLGKKMNWNFRVVWAGTHEFLHQEEFFSSLPPVPHIIIFDDISGALDQASGAEIAANFNSLTRIRHILDKSGRGEIPCIIIADFHYSKDLEKKIRSQLDMSVYVGLSQEEITNASTISGYHDTSNNTLKAFAKITTTMFDKHKFYLHLPNGRAIEHILDDPFRPMVAITKGWSSIMLYSNKDYCAVCTHEQKKVKKMIPAKELVDMLENDVYRHAGIKALQHIGITLGYKEIADDYLIYAINFILRKIIPFYDFNWQEVIDEVRKRKGGKKVAKKYRKPQKEADALHKIDSVSKLPEIVIENDLLLSNTGGLIENPHP